MGSLHKTGFVQLMTMTLTGPQTVAQRVSPGRTPFTHSSARFVLGCETHEGCYSPMTATFQC